MYQKKWSLVLSTILHRCFSNFFRNPAKPIDSSQVFRVASEISLLCSLSCGTSDFYQCLKFRTFGRKPLSSCVFKKNYCSTNQLQRLPLTNPIFSYHTLLPVLRVLPNLTSEQNRMGFSLRVVDGLRSRLSRKGSAFFWLPNSLPAKRG